MSRKHVTWARGLTVHFLFPRSDSNATPTEDSSATLTEDSNLADGSQGRLADGPNNAKPADDPQSKPVDDTNAKQVDDPEAAAASAEPGGSPPEQRLQRARDAKRKIGVPTASMLIFNRIIGTGIFATPAQVFALSGSVGLSMFIWLIGSIIAAAGTAVYLEWGTGMPKNGGEKNYLEHIFRKPRFLVTAMYASYIVLLGWAAGNSIIFGQYLLNAARVPVTHWNQRGLGLVCVTVAFLVHGTCLRAGLMLQNVLGLVKIAILFAIVVAPLCKPEVTRMIDGFDAPFFGTTGSAYGVVTALYNVIWSYVGYSNANYALSETRNPTRTLKIAAPFALGTVTVFYMLANVSYFAGVSKEDMLKSESLVAAVLFRNMFGTTMERALSALVALSAFGNVLSVIFSQGRLVQELGREGILPFSSFWASNRPYNAPLAGLFEHWLVTVVTILAPPPGDAYNFILNLISYPLAIINIFVAGGLLHLYHNRESWNWKPPIKAGYPVVVFFLISNIFLAVAPFVPPSPGQSVYKSLPYWIHCVVGIGVLLAGAVYWFVWARVLPWMGKYELVETTAVDEIDGWERRVFSKRPKQA